MLDAHELQVDEALLTGESAPSDRRPQPPCPRRAPVADRTTMLHGGTLVVHGTGRAVVVATGAASQLGRIARMLHEHAAPATPLQRRLAALGRRLSLLVTACCIVVVVLGLLRGKPWELTVVTGISLAVAAIPESLPAVVALALAGGTRRMAERGAIVRSLPAVEALGSVTVLATDKTGTLTAGSTACVAAWTPTSGTCSAPLDAGGRDGTAGGGRCSATTRRGPRRHRGCARGRPHLRPGSTSTPCGDSAPRTAEVPFDSLRRSMRTRHASTAANVEIVKGAPGGGVRRAADARTVAGVVEDWASRGVPRAGGRRRAARQACGCSGSSPWPTRCAPRPARRCSPPAPPASEPS